MFSPLQLKEPLLVLCDDKYWYMRIHYLRFIHIFWSWIPWKAENCKKLNYCELAVHGLLTYMMCAWLYIAGTFCCWNLVETTYLRIGFSVVVKKMMEDYWTIIEKWLIISIYMQFIMENLLHVICYQCSVCSCGIIKVKVETNVR